MRDYLEEFLIKYGWGNVSGMSVDLLYFHYVGYCEDQKISYYTSRTGFAKQMTSEFGFKIVRKRINGKQKRFFV